MKKYTPKHIAKSDDLFNEEIKKVSKFYLSSDPEHVAMLKGRKVVVRKRNKELSPLYNDDYYCGTCGAKDGAEHPQTGYCFYCDTDNWNPKDYYETI